MENGTKVVVGIGITIVAVGLGVGLWFIFKKPKEITLPSGETIPTTPEHKSETEPNKGSGGGDKDYTNVEKHPNSATEKNGLFVGQEVTIKSGETITRLNKNLSTAGTVQLKTRTALGRVFALNPSSVIIKQNKKFSYPFYMAAYSQIEQSNG